mmetsp:Transcript_24604/g.41853  ORF Transcript_24604/g.41853 Transcript_24604/m.41853 type:complete len:98 (-) Transcript_24604:2191-2484(-)
MTQLHGHSGCFISEGAIVNPGCASDAAMAFVSPVKRAIKLFQLSPEGRTRLIVFPPDAPDPPQPLQQPQQPPPHWGLTTPPTNGTPGYPGCPGITPG